MNHTVTAEMTANVWKITTALGESADPETELCVLESMKMEIPVEAGSTGVVAEILIAEGETVTEGQGLFVISPA